MTTTEAEPDWQDWPPEAKARYRWLLQARPDQLPPESDWLVWLILAGRGWGKTRTGAEWLADQAKNRPRSRWAIVAPTFADGRDTCVEGESGLLFCLAYIFKTWNRSMGELTLHNGALIKVYSAEEPERLRGPQFHGAWCLKGNTLVRMGDGSHRRLDRVQPGDYVATPLGSRQVQAAGETAPAADIWRLVTEDGRELRGTADHPVWADGAFQSLASVRPGAMVTLCHALWSLMESASSSTARTITGTREDNSSTGSSGSTITDPSRADVSSTTSTRTSSTTGLRISPSWARERTTPTTAHEDGRSGPRPSAQREFDAGGPVASPPPVLVSGADGSIRPVAPIAGGVRRSALLRRVTTVEPTGERAPVYNLTVNGGQFYANDILTHNCDELAAWNDAQAAWDQLQYGLRLGLRPQVAVTTTPRPIPIVRELLDRNAIATDIAITRGNTFDNAENLAPSALEALQRRYGGTRQGRQELYAEVLVDTPGALWTTEQLDKLRVEKAPELERVVVAIDPAVSSHEDSDETGIMVVGRGRNGEGYVLTDWSGRYSPDGWGRRAVELLAIHGGDRVVAEVNNGGDLVAHVLQTVDPNTPYRAVRASRGKRIRAEPVAALYEQGRVHHVGEAANLAELEKQLTGWSPEDKGDSPDRLDALVWGLWEVMGLESLGPVFLGAA